METTTHTKKQAVIAAQSLADATGKVYGIEMDGRSPSIVAITDSRTARRALERRTTVVLPAQAGRLTSAEGVLRLMAE